MEQTLLFLLLNSLYINGLRLAFEEGMIFEKLNDLVPAIIQAILYICALAAVNTIIYKKLIDDSY